MNDDFREACTDIEIARHRIWNQYLLHNKTPTAEQLLQLQNHATHLMQLAETIGE